MNVLRLLCDAEYHHDMEWRKSHVFFYHHKPATFTGDLRRVFSDEQQRQLLIEYERCPYPSVTKRRQIAQRLDTTSRRVQIWFQNKRQSITSVTSLKSKCLPRMTHFFGFKIVEWESQHIQGGQELIYATIFRFHPDSVDTPSNKTHTDADPTGA
ncbi:hypothetical protein PROFUN_13716 [Planoprotostelium fungivorum]|uniref:Homeobox domain-containing protein n=1 Tax=Planoprotostelium fungivorum TaxID=1890364 RepID=A0A2P6N3B1_9EUKA|nr:hypothetical protein PROFUN_13716 [Planoprotostelium fungivorum]